MSKTFYRYDVEIRPEQPKMKKRRVLEQLVARPPFQGTACATDYSKFIVTTADLKSEIKAASHGKITIPSVNANSQPGGSPPPVRPSDTVQYRISSAGSFNVRDLMDYLTSTAPGASYAGVADLIQMLNIIMCKVPNETAAVANLPGNKFYPHQGLPGLPDHPRMEFAELAGGLMALRGYFASVRPATGRVLLNLNVTTGAFYQPIPLLDLFMRCGITDISKREMFVKKLKVQYVRPGKTPIKQVRTIFGFAKTPPMKDKKAPPFSVERFGNARQVKFTYEDRTGSTPQRRTTSVFDYFKDQQGVILQRPEIPVLNTGTLTDPIYVPIEMCTVLPGQSFRKVLSGDQTTQMLEFAARFPNQNAVSIAGSSTDPGTGLRLFQLADPAMNNPQAQSTQPFGFRVTTTMLTVPGRILDAPAVKYRKKSVRANNGSWNCADQTFVKGGSYESFAVCVLNERGRQETLRSNPQGDMLPPEQLISTLRNFLTNYGRRMGTWNDMTFDTVEPLDGMNNRGKNNSVLDALFAKASKRQVRILFMVLPRNDKWLYARIKYYADTQYGIQTICSVGSKLQKPNGQGMYMGNLALKFNIKGNGINHQLDQMLVNPLDANTMLIGIDVTHPSPQSAKGAPSIACVVANKDKHLCQWPGSIRKQKGKQEMVDDKERKEADTVKSLEDMIVERLNCWQENPENGRALPKKILVYRDGVSEGQYQLVLERELPHFRAAFNRKYGPEKNHPRMAVIVVGKRHHTRFYPTQDQDADFNPQRQKGSLNCKPGTVVDRGITGKILHEFFLQAHQGLQGTARPAHYVVIKDDIGFDANSLEQITHHLCYMFGRATKAVSIVPPAYYADILAERARAYLYNTLQEDRDDSTTASGGATEWDGTIHPNLKNTFFYI